MSVIGVADKVEVQILVDNATDMLSLPKHIVSLS
jgi:hypothetical protein